MKNAENNALGERGVETKGCDLERLKSAVMADVSKYLKVCGGSCGESKGNMLPCVEAQLGPTAGRRMGLTWIQQ